MRAILTFAAIALVVGVFGARFAERAIDETPRAAAVEPAAPPPSPESRGSGHSMVVDSDRQGHFRVDARVDGRRLEFIVDTGASLVVLRESDATNLGIRPLPVDYKATVSTANGRIKAAPATLARVEIGDITVFDVPALVMPDAALSQNLLGVSFLSKLRRYEYAAGRLVLEQ
jgi:aspartyl protease family protein